MSTGFLVFGIEVEADFVVWKNWLTVWEFRLQVRVLGQSACGANINSEHWRKKLAGQQIASIESSCIRDLIHGYSNSSVYEDTVALGAFSVAVRFRCLLAHDSQCSIFKPRGGTCSLELWYLPFQTLQYSQSSYTNEVKHSSNRLSQRSILSLDKSDAPFSTLIDEACDFLDIRLEEDGITLLYDKSSLDIQVGTDPRVDWALRWLLKNLQTAEVRPGR